MRKKIADGQGRKVYIDALEADRVSIAKRKFKYFNFEPVVERLEYGDYVCGDCVVEFKTANDFVSSIGDGRLKKESIEQAIAYPHHYVFVVGNVIEALRFLRRIKKLDSESFYGDDTYYRVVGDLLLYTNVVQVQDYNTAFNLMARVFASSFNSKKTQPLIPIEKLHPNPCVNILRCIKGVGEDRAVAIVETLDIHTIKGLFRVTQKDLQTVHGVGRILSKKIYHQLREE